MERESKIQKNMQLDKAVELLVQLVGFKNIGWRLEVKDKTCYQN